jgi:nitrogen fixation NifU-like protein
MTGRLGGLRIGSGKLTRLYDDRQDTLTVLMRSAGAGRYGVHSPELLDHFRNPRNVGDLPAPAVTAEVSNPACGDTMRLSILWENGRVVQSAFRCRGCTASVAAGSALTELLAGLSREEAARIESGAIEQAVGGLPPESRHAASLCVDAIRAVLRVSR